MNVFVHDMTLIYHRADATPAIPCGLVARISGSHPGGPGSIPGMGEIFLVKFTYANKHLTDTNFI